MEHPSPSVFKVLASDLHTLTHSVSHIESVGTITSVEYKASKFVKFTVDDGTGLIPCILWLNHLSSPYFSKRTPQSVRLISDIATCQAREVRVGRLGRVRGRLGSFRGELQVTVEDVVVERDPNVEVLHWLQCIRLARRCYDVKSSRSE